MEDRVWDVKWAYYILVAYANTLQKVVEWIRSKPVRQKNPWVVDKGRLHITKLEWWLEKKLLLYNESLSPYPLISRTRTKTRRADLDIQKSKQSCLADDVSPHFLLFTSASTSFNKIAFKQKN